MYKNLLVPTDGSKLSLKAVEHATALAKAVGAKMTIFYAAPGYPQPMYAEGVVYDAMPKKEYDAAVKKEADKLLGKLVANASAAGVGAVPAHTISDAPWEAILAAAKKTKADAIVMASHGRRGLSAMLLGSETQKVLTHSKITVIVVR
jgi:nucleotide-binding universal stress UspA family protein